MAAGTGSDNAVRFDVPSRELLEELAAAPPPLQLRAGRATRSFHRDIYLDTPDAALERLGVTCRFRIATDDRRTLRVVIRSAVAGGALVEYDQFEDDVPEVDPLAALQGTSEPARRLRAVIDPRQLGLRLELQTERITRVLRPRWLPLRVLEIAYDTVAVHSGGASRTFHEIRVRRLAPGGPGVDEVAETLRAVHNLDPVSGRRVERAEEVLAALETAREEPAPRLPEVALVAAGNGWMAVRYAEGRLALPRGAGSGEEVARRLAQESVGVAPASLDLLGPVTGFLGGSMVEVWLARATPERPPPGTRWIRGADVLALAGSPHLVEGPTLATLALLARHDAIATFEEAVGSEPPGSLSRDELREAVGRAEAPGEEFLDADLSLLEFNGRVLEMADDPGVPLLARLRFLAIHGSNTDEFFMVRVGGLEQVRAEGGREGVGGEIGVHDRLAAIAVRVRQQLRRQRRCLEERLLPALAAHGIRLLSWEDLDPDERRDMARYYQEQVFPLLTPHAVTRAPGHPFPHVENLRLSLAAMVRDEETGRLRFGITSLPAGLPRFVPVSGGRGVVPLEEVVRANLEKLYPGRRVEAAHCFRVTRSGEVELDEEAAEDLVEAVEEQLRRREFAAVVRLELERAMPPVMRDLLLRELRVESGGRGPALGAAGIFEVEGLLDVSALGELADVGPPELDHPSLTSRTPLPAEGHVFQVVRGGDVLVHHPYDAFESTTLRLFDEAARDPAVVAIKAVLYRVGRRSPLVEALIAAARRGKTVDVLVELKARFDEERNVEWVRRLEAGGVHVVRGLVRLKTHCKLALVVRRENGVARRYVHIGTGNYNAATARLYTDLGLLSADPRLGEDVHDLFNQLLGSSRPSGSPFRRLLVAPTAMLPRFLELIAREAEHARAGRPAGIRVKVNGLADREVVRALYAASGAGVPVDLVVRGPCILRPGVPGLSQGVRVVSVLGRFLEHARIFHFRNGGDDEYYIGSADWRPRNLRRRVEVVTPVSAPAARARLDRILTVELADPTAWDLRPDGTYARRSCAGEGGPSAQEVFLAG